MATQDEILQAINDAADQAAISALIEEHKEALLSGDDLASYDLMPDGGGRQKAVGLGVEEYLKLFGDFESFADLQDALSLHVNTEFDKQAFLQAISGDASEETIKDLVLVLSADRQDIIGEYAQGPAAAKARAAELTDETYTKVLAEVASHVDDAAYLSAIAQALSDARGTIGGSIVKAIETLDTASDAAIVAIFDTDNVAAMTAAIEEYAATLLSPADAAHYVSFPDGGGRQNAVAKGIIEIAKLEGAFASVADITAAFANQVTVEHNKQAFLQAITNGAPAPVIQTLITALHEDRQATISKWAEGTDDAKARATELQNDPYTKVLAEVSKYIGVPAYLTAISAALSEANDTISGSIVRAIAALEAASDSSAALLAIFNADSETVLTSAIEDYAATLLNSANLALYDSFPDGGGRQNAVAKGIIEIARLEGGFQDVAGIKAAFTNQVGVEHNKQSFLQAISGNATLEDIKSLIEDLNADRQATIAKWSEGTPAARARAVELTNETYTKVLAEVATHVDDAAYLSAIAQALSDARGTIGGSIVKAIETLDTASDAAIVTIFNSDGEATLTSAIEEYAATLLSPADAIRYDSFPDGGGRQNAVAKGIIEIAKLEGDFTSLAQVQAAFANQVQVEHNKQAFLQAISSDAPASTIKSLIEDLSADRLATIAKWSNGSDAAKARAEELANEVYTKVLARVAGAIDNDVYLTVIVEALSDAKVTIGGSIVRAITALDSVNFAPLVGDAVTVVTNEDVAVTGSVGISDADGDALAYALKADGAPAKGLVQLNGDGTFVYTPGKDLNGDDSFTVVVTDARGLSVEKTIKIGINPVNDAPGDVGLSNAVVAENSASGTVVGALSAFDLDGDSSFNFALLDDAGGRFAVQNGSLVVANGLGLDYEQATSHTVIVRAADAGGAVFDKALTVYLTDVASEKVAGTATSDVIVGGNGRDVISGGLGRDILTGGKGKDTFVFNTKVLKNKSNVDKITDFSVKDDTIKLDNAIFKKLGKGSEKKPGKLDKDFFTIGTKAQDADDYLIYNKKTGALSYDADGSGKGAAIVFASLSKNLKLTEKDFLIV